MGGVKSYQDQAIVIRGYKLGEADRIVVLLTERHGVSRAVARGARRPGSRFAGHLEPFMLVRVMLHRGREMDVVTQAETVNDYRALRSDYESFVFGQPMLELSWKSLKEGQDSSRVFQALAVSLTCLEEKVAPPPLLLSAFELKMCSLLGFRPSLRRCAHCGSTLKGASFLFDAGCGGSVCAGCASPALSRRVQAETLAVAEALIASPLRELAKITASPESMFAVFSLVAEYVEFQLGQRLRSHDVVLKHLKSLEGPSGKSGGEE